MPTVQINFTADRVFRVLLIAMFVVLVASTAIRVVVHATGHDYIFGLVRLLYVDQESNVPTLFSVSLLLGAAGLLGIVAVAERKAASPFWRHWGALAVGFVAIAADEFMSLHELLTGPIRGAAAGAMGNLFHYGWIAVGFPLALLLGVAFWRFLGHLPARTRLQFIAAGAMFIGGALVLEALGGVIAASLGPMSVAHSVAATIEEALEMLGVIWFIRELLRYLADNHGNLLVATEETTQA